MAAPTTDQKAQAPAQAPASKSESDLDLTQTTTEKPAKKEKRVVRRPEYGLQAVEAVPEAPPSVRGREELFVTTLAPLLDQPGQLFKVAHYATPNGAEKAAEALEKGERKLPGNTETKQWEFTGVKVENPETEGGPRHSELYVKFLG